MASNGVPDYLQSRGIVSVEDNARGKAPNVDGKLLFQLFKEQLIKQYVKQPGSPLAVLRRDK